MSDYDLRELQEAQLETLDELKRVCGKNDLRFYLAYGSCIGALRHKGIIPWDDDIDILMPVKDYDRLMELADEFGEGFFLQNSDTDPNFRAAIARVRKNGTACVEESELSWKCHQGIYIDIYPQYQYPNGLFKRAGIVLSSVFYRTLLLNRAPVNHGPLIRFAGNVLLFFLRRGNREKQLAKYKQRLRKHEGTEYVADLYGMDLTWRKVLKYRQEWFGEPQWVEFEGRSMPVPTGAESYLKDRYGDDVMELPPEEKRQSYHRYAVVSFEREYHPEETERAQS